MSGRQSLCIALVGLTAAFASALAAPSPVGLAAAPGQDQAPMFPAPLPEMRHHFLEVTRLHEAVIRGDLPAVRAAASAVAEMPLPSGVAPETSRYVDQIRTAARRAAVASSLSAAASSTAQVLGQCGACHLTNVRPALPEPTARDLSSVVGHMQEHQQSVDELLQGLVIPSTNQWNAGARRLSGEPLSSDRLPPDPGLTARVTEAEARVHALGARAGAATDTDARMAVYADLLTTCAECHSLHGRVWGPRSTTGAGS